MDYVAKPLLWQLLPLLFIWEAGEALSVRSNELLDLLHRETFILWNAEVLDVIGFDRLLGTGDEVLEKATEELEQEMATY